MMVSLNQESKSSAKYIMNILGNVILVLNLLKFTAYNARFRQIF